MKKQPRPERMAAVISDPRWTAVVARDPSADGQFYYSVKTTGVYCRPSCAARTAKPENVQFHSTADAAEHAGFRPCKRCKPDQASQFEQRAVLVTELCRFIEAAPHVPSLQELAQHAGLSSYHLHRLFKSATGLTPRGYAIAHRARRVRSELKRANTVTQAIYAAGYNSNGRFYESSNQVLGMTPDSFRNGGNKTAIRFAVGQCALGAILVAASELGVCSILMGDDPEALVHGLQDVFPRATLIGGDAGFEQLISKVVGFIEMPQSGLDLPLDVRGTAFQQRVWLALRDIPVGETASYADIARRIGSPKSVRAVAGACAANSWRSRFPAIAWCAPMVACPAIVGGWSASARCWSGKRKGAMSSNTHSTCSIALPDDFRVGDVFEFHRRDAREVAEKIAGNSLRKGLVWRGRAACLTIRFNAGQADVELAVDGRIKVAPSDLNNLVQRMLGLNQQVEKFENAFRDHPQIGFLITSRPGLRVPVAATPFEALTWAVTGQQISLSAAVALRRKLIWLAGVRHSGGLACYPDAGLIANLTEEQLRQAGFSTGKAQTLLALSREVMADRLPLEAWLYALPVDEIRERLLRIRGIGPWTVNYALLRGFGWLDGSLHGDAAVRRQLQQLLGATEKVDEGFARQWLAKFSPWRALAAAHLWAMA